MLMMRAKLLRMLAVRGVVDFSRGTRILDDAPESESESGSDICNEEDMW